MNLFLRLLCCLFFSCLVGCVTQQKVLVKPQDIKQCKMRCAQRFDSCQKLCTNNCFNCSTLSSITSAANYAEYVHEKQVRGGIITRGLNSYRDPLQCRKVTCSCSTDLMTCNQGCTGIIQKGLRSVPYCT